MQPAEQYVDEIAPDILSEIENGLKQKAEEEAVSVLRFWNETTTQTQQEMCMFLAFHDLGEDL